MDLMHNQAIKIVGNQLQGIYRIILDEPFFNRTVLVRLDPEDDETTKSKGGRKPLEETKNPRKKSPAPNIGTLIWADRSLLEELDRKHLVQTIEIEKGGARAPTAIIRAGVLGHIGKCPVTVVAQELVGADVGAIEVHPAIVVEVAGGHPHAIVRGDNPRRLGDIGEFHHPGAVRLHLEIVAVETIGKRQRMLDHRRQLVIGLLRAQQLTLGPPDIEVTVPVVVE